MIHAPSVFGRARADRGPLLLTALVVFLAVLITAAVPPLLQERADRAVTDVVSAEGNDARLSAAVTFDPESPAYPRARIDDSAGIVDWYRENASMYLDSTLQPLFGPPVTIVSSPDLQVTGRTPGLNLRLVHGGTGSPAGPAVTWVEGRAPAADPSLGGARTGPEPWPVQVGLPEATAQRLGLGVGDVITAEDPKGAPIEAHVSGTYRATDASDPLWRFDPQLLAADVFTDTRGLTSTHFAALMSDDSLPDGRLATDPGYGLYITVGFAAEPGRITRANAPAAIDALVSLEAGTSGAEVDGPTISFSTGLDTVLQRLLAQITTTVALATVLLAALLVAVALALVLTADLLTRRRATVLTGLRRRGASLPGLGFELGVESLALTLVSGGAGLLAAQLLAGSVSVLWPLPMLLVGVLGGPLVAVVHAARATPRKGAPANRSARRTIAVTRQLRRLTLEVAIVAGAAAAYTALKQRGVTADDVLPALAPALVAVTGGVLLLRVFPGLTRLFLKLGNRFRGGLPLLAASRASATVARPLPVVLIVTSVALAVFTLSVRATAAQRVPTGQDSRPFPEALSVGLLDLALVTSVLLVLLAVLAVALGTLGSAPDRAETGARLRTLGMTTSDTRWIALGELLPVALVGGAVGWVLGRVLASQAVGLLSLRVLQDLPADPALVVPVATCLPVLVLPAVVVALVLVETSLRRRERLGQVLRA
ncbi:putative ABC transport system permease protein [Kineosporia succinea]|uniref:ABC transport system permease protein n=1 Tax=Kineosporia succinea TaxID=84632 RepID=A0ABT9NY57_9ACTN|nr:FtsX-like permease family protein [Kineosporia succinea]MDP9824925.1 putative ABC transport system permease protein [Kineosporia succinea]